MLVTCILDGNQVTLVSKLPTNNTKIMLDQSQNAAFAERFRKQLGATVVDNFFRGLAGASVRMPPAQRALQKHEIIRDVPYRADRGERDHLLDVYLPDDGHEGPHPVLLYVHGGGYGGGG